MIPRSPTHSCQRPRPAKTGVATLRQNHLPPRPLRGPPSFGNNVILLPNRRRCCRLPPFLCPPTRANLDPSPSLRRTKRYPLYGGIGRGITSSRFHRQPVPHPYSSINSREHHLSNRLARQRAVRHSLRASTHTSRSYSLLRKSTCGSITLSSRSW